MLRHLAQDFAEVPAQARAALAVGDPAQAARLLHGLRGAAGTLAAIEIATVASALEAQIRDGHTAETETDFLRLEIALTRLIEAIRTHGLDQSGTDPRARGQALTESLLDALDTQSLSALPQAEALRTDLATVLPPGVWESLMRAIEGLRFAEAAALLRRSLDPGRKEGWPDPSAQETHHVTEGSGEAESPQPSRPPSP
ncbi:Hpt domain-containing protein [Pararhodospirillum photometricum]|uniref:Signal transduction histidine kinase-like protein n=1 Tax=Pararhodospirillum photometricum DSM 122 TaxID=1150469 RepID=H6SKH3_PARPM|nr:Hpt domain-containing protein [Pararhodospirillum photometricum]CCG08488.1 Signal transduction histidine kinase-like protein [Pararhodospirillum photometricum DSM 122]